MASSQRRGVAAVKPLASVYVEAKKVAEFCAAFLPNLRVPILLVTGSTELPQVERSNCTDGLRGDPRIAHWFSQNPIYAPSQRYAGWGYGVLHHNLGALARALLRQAAGRTPTKQRGLAVTSASPASATRKKREKKDRA